jgi:hypothetical protein
MEDFGFACSTCCRSFLDDILREMLKQVVEQTANIAVLDPIRHLYLNVIKEQSSGPSVATLVECLAQTTRGHTKFFIVFDQLDELEERDRSTMAEVVKILVDNGLRILITACNPKVTESLSEVMQIDTLPIFEQKTRKKGWTIVVSNFAHLFRPHGEPGRIFVGTDRPARK